MRRGFGLAVLLILVACGRTERPASPPVAAPPADPSVGAWSWHPLGPLAVVEGEVKADTELILEGPSIRERRYAEPGPVRWEFFRPPEGEAAVLRTPEGQELARFTFTVAPARPEAQPHPAPLARRTPPPAPASPQRPPAGAAPPIRAEARLRAQPAAPIPLRKPLAVSTAPASPVELPRRIAAFTPLAPELVTPRPAAPLPAPATRTTPVRIPSGTAAGWPGGGEGLNLTRGPSGQKRLLLSFDGGSTAEVATEVLDLLKARGIHTTFFLTGAFIQRYPALVRRMAAEGHELGNHTMNHPHMAPGMKRDPAWTRERIQRELLDADAMLVKLLGRPMDPYWRAPYGEHTAEIRKWAEELGYRHVGWSEGADTLDWATVKDRRLYRSGDAILKRLQQRLNRDGDGLIVLMHLGSGRAEGDRPTEDLGAFLDRARREGYTFVTAGAILSDLGKPTWDPHQRMALLQGGSAPAR